MSHLFRRKCKLLITPDKELATTLPESAGKADVLISLEHVSVVYRAPREPVATFKEYAIRLFKGGLAQEEFRALNDVSFEVRRGEVFGIVGHNGAGKSTLLKVVSRVLKPTQGRVRVYGRLAPLLELGAGFHPELSGRENVFLNGTLLGYSQTQIAELFDDIVDFAELEDFIDAPLRTYSTGMSVRLGFAVATALRPDILLVDEVLAVGDEAFQRKCAARIAEFRQRGTTVLLVTHDTQAVLRMCDRAVWLDHGQAKAFGAVDEVVYAYRAASNQVSNARRPRSSARKALAAVPSESPSLATVPRQLTEPIYNTEWLYPFELPGEQPAPFQLHEGLVQLHQTRWQMLRHALENLNGGNWASLRCLDIGCNQGYFALQLARLGCYQVVGFDARSEHISAAELMRRAWGLENLQFRHLDLFKLKPAEFEPFDVVLLLGALHQYEDPIGVLRQAKHLATRAVIVETQLGFDQTGDINWGAHDNFKRYEGAFAVLDRADELDSPWGSLSPITLIPGRETLLWIMRKLGFARVEELPVPPDSYEQFVSGKRVMIAGYL